MGLFNKNKNKGMSALLGAASAADTELGPEDYEDGYDPDTEREWYAEQVRLREQNKD